MVVYSSVGLWENNNPAGPLRSFLLLVANSALLEAQEVSGVEKRRSDGSLPVAIGGAFATPPQSGLT